MEAHSLPARGRLAHPVLREEGIYGSVVRELEIVKDERLKIEAKIKDIEFERLRLDAELNAVQRHRLAAELNRLTAFSSSLQSRGYTKLDPETENETARGATSERDITAGFQMLDASSKSGENVQKLSKMVASVSPANEREIVKRSAPHSISETSRDLIPVAPERGNYVAPEPSNYGRLPSQYLSPRPISARLSARSASWPVHCSDDNSICATMMEAAHNSTVIKFSPREYGILSPTLTTQCVSQTNDREIVLRELQIVDDSGSSGEWVQEAIDTPNSISETSSANVLVVQDAATGAAAKVMKMKPLSDIPKLRLDLIPVAPEASNYVAPEPSNYGKLPSQYFSPRQMCARSADLDGQARCRSLPAHPSDNHSTTSTTQYFRKEYSDAQQAHDHISRPHIYPASAIQQRSTDVRRDSFPQSHMDGQHVYVSASTHHDDQGSQVTEMVAQLRQEHLSAHEPTAASFESSSQSSTSSESPRLRFPNFHRSFLWSSVDSTASIASLRLAEIDHAAVVAASRFCTNNSSSVVDDSGSSGEWVQEAIDTPLSISGTSSGNVLLVHGAAAGAAAKVLKMKPLRDIPKLRLDLIPVAPEASNYVAPKRSNYGKLPSQYFSWPVHPSDNHSICATPMEASKHLSDIAFSPRVEALVAQLLQEHLSKQEPLAASFESKSLRQEAMEAPSIPLYEKVAELYETVHQKLMEQIAVSSRHEVFSSAEVNALQTASNSSEASRAPTATPYMERGEMWSGTQGASASSGDHDLSSMHSDRPASAARRPASPATLLLQRPIPAVKRLPDAREGGGPAQASPLTKQNSIHNQKLSVEVPASIGMLRPAAAQQAAHAMTGQLQAAYEKAAAAARAHSRDGQQPVAHLRREQQIYGKQDPPDSELSYFSAAGTNAVACAAEVQARLAAADAIAVAVWDAKTRTNVIDLLVENNARKSLEQVKHDTKKNQADLEEEYKKRMAAIQKGNELVYAELARKHKKSVQVPASTNLQSSRFSQLLQPRRGSLQNIHLPEDSTLMPHTNPTALHRALPSEISVNQNQRSSLDEGNFTKYEMARQMLALRDSALLLDRQPQDAQANFQHSPLQANISNMRKTEGQILEDEQRKLQKGFEIATYGAVEKESYIRDGRPFLIGTGPKGMELGGYNPQGGLQFSKIAAARGATSARNITDRVQMLVDSSKPGESVQKYRGMAASEYRWAADCPENRDNLQPSDISSTNERGNIAGLQIVDDYESSGEWVQEATDTSNSISETRSGNGLHIHDAATGAASKVLKMKPLRVIHLPEEGTLIPQTNATNLPRRLGDEKNVQHYDDIDDPRNGPPPLMRSSHSNWHVFGSIVYAKASEKDVPELLISPHQVNRQQRQASPPISLWAPHGGVFERPSGWM